MVSYLFKDMKQPEKKTVMQMQQHQIRQLVAENMIVKAIETLK
jgi:hypothetical protein